MLALTLAVVTLSAAVVPVGALGTPSEGEAPLADAGLDQRVTVGTTVTLDATGSRDPDGRVVSYRWRVERPDGRTTTTAPPNRGRTTLHVTQTGRYEVTVTVTDDDGNAASDTLYIVVDGTPTRPATPVSTPERPVTTPSTGPSETTPVSTVPTPTMATSAPDPRPSPTVTTTGPAAGPTAPSIATTGGPEATPPTEPTCAETFGPGCIPVVTSDCSTTMARDCIRTVRISGPDTLAEGEVGTYTAVTNGFDGDVSFRWQAGEVSRSVERSFSPGEHTVVVTATDGESTFIAEKTVYVERNAPPRVSIEDPGDLTPGESIVLSLDELRDPDGIVTSVSWEGGSRVREVGSMEHVRSVTVPRGNDSVSVEVTARDDDGATAVDIIDISSDQQADLRYTQQDAKRTAQCTYYDYGSKVTDQPIRCWDKETGELIYDRDPDEGPDDFVGPHSHPDWDVDWYQVARPDDDTIKPGTAMAEDVPSPSNPTQIENTDRADNVPPLNETVIDTINSSSAASGLETYTKDGRSVSNDLTGDGVVNLQDWQERYGSSEAQSIEEDEEKISQLNSDSKPEETEDEAMDNGGRLTETVQDAFSDIADTVTSVAGNDRDSDDQSSHSEPDSSTDSESDPVTDTVSAVTDAFADLSIGSGDSTDSDESSDDTTQNEDSDTGGAGDSCSETTLGFEICL